MKRLVALLLCAGLLGIVPFAPAELDPDLEKKVKKSVDRGLRFLREQQNDDGSWNAPHGEPHPGITALVLVGFLRSPREYDDTDGPFMRRPVEYLLALQKEDGGIYDRELQNYVTAVSLMALRLAADRFVDEELVARIRVAIEGAKGFLVELQADEGEGYTPEDKLYGGVGYGGDLRPDLSNTQLAMDALHEAGLPTDHPFFDKAVRFVQRCQNRSESNDQAWAGSDGGFVYYPGKTYAGEVVRPDGSKGLRSYGSMTYAGMKSFLHAGFDRDDPRIKAAYDWIQGHYTVDENPELGLQGLFYYYHTFAKALHLLGVETIEDEEGVAHDWRADLGAKLVDLQNRGEGELFGSWANEEERWWEGDPLLATAFSILALEYVLE
jgi:squalene-hopene/tetraprenyl-beta-curcumene cyclase